MLPHPSLVVWPFVSPTKSWLLFGGLLFALLRSPSDAVAQVSATGMIEGQVLSAASGGFLNNATVAIQGLPLKASTDRNGRFVLSNVPPGEVTLVASYVGMDKQTAKAHVVAGHATRQNFELVFGGAVIMEAFTVEEREATAQMLALNEQRQSVNIKNVVSSNEFGNLGEGNIGEFVKFIPGIQVEYSANFARGISIRGLPSTHTLLLIDGVEVASGSAAAARGVVLDPIQMNSLDRVEVTKVPTPDLPANTLGGIVNAISKSGFDRPRPEFTYKVYSLFNSNAPKFEAPSRLRDELSSSLIQPGVDFSYIAPINDRLGIAFNGSVNTRYTEFADNTAGRDLIRQVTISDSARYAGDRLQQRFNGSLKIDSKLSKYDTLSLSLQYFGYSSLSADASQNANLGAGATGDANFTQGTAAAVGTVTRNFSNNLNAHEKTAMMNLRYRHQGLVWNIDAHAGYSYGYHDIKDIAKGFFSSINHSITNLVLRGEGIGTLYPYTGFAKVTATTAAGVPVNLFDANEYSLNSTSILHRDSYNYKKEVAVNAARSFSGKGNLTLKSGLFAQEQIKDIRTLTPTWNFRPGTTAAVRSIRNYDVLLDHTLPFKQFNDQPVIAIDPYKVYNLYKSRPDYFVQNPAAVHQNAANGSQYLFETILASYVRGDVTMFDERLRIVTGVRYEFTEDEGEGLLNNPGAIYRRDNAGNFIRDANGALIPVTTDALEAAKLRYTDRGKHSKADYDGFFPSFNASLDITPNLVLKAGYARTIGRPNLNFIIPGMTLPDPGVISTTTPRITVVNTGLRPWTADAFDLSLESYLIKGGFGAVSVFQKNIVDFFGEVISPVTPTFLTENGLPSDYSGYEVATRANIGSVVIKGAEFNYRQDLAAVKPWLKGFQVFFNVTALDLNGPNTADFTQFNPRTINYGINYVRPKFAIRINWAENKTIRGAPVSASATVPAGAYSYRPGRNVVGANVEYQLFKKFSVTASFRNLGDAPDFTEVYAPGTPEHLRRTRYLGYGADCSVGIQGKF